jgi:hypothetical protein
VLQGIASVLRSRLLLGGVIERLTDDLSGKEERL